VLALPSGGESGRAGEPEDDGQAATTRDATPGRTMILVCDDEDSVRSLVVRVLRRAGLEAEEAATGLAALAVVETGRVSAIVADHHLGAMSGLELYALAVASDPALRGRFVFMSGDAGDGALADFASANGLPVVAKPFADLRGLAALVRDLPVA